MAFSEGYRAPRFRDIGLALLIGVVVLVAFLKLGDVVKRVGAVFYFLPAQLGIVQQTGRGEVWRYRLDSMPDVISFAEPGRYAVYTGDYDLLTITDSLRQQDAPSWLTVKAADTGERVTVDYVGRGMRLYDSHLAPGRPVLTIQIPRAGFYTLEHSARPALIAIARDYVTGTEGRILAVFFVESVLIASPFLLFYGRKYWLRRSARRKTQARLREEADAVFRSMAERRAQGQTSDADPHAAFRPKK